MIFWTNPQLAARMHQATASELHEVSTATVVARRKVSPYSRAKARERRMAYLLETWKLAAYEREYVESAEAKNGDQERVSAGNRGTAARRSADGQRVL